MLFVTVAYLFIPGVVSLMQLNKLDRFFMRYMSVLPLYLSKAFCRLLPSKSRKLSSTWKVEAVQKIVLSVSDQQLITELLILTVGFMKHSTITQYHFYIFYLLGLASFTVHQSTVIILQEYLSENTAMAIWKVSR
jgi:hypothetical protein